MTDFLHSRYHLVEVLGQGAMGVVWQAHDSVLQRDIAIKELRAVPGVDPAEALERFLVEARAAARLSHPNIVAIHDVFRESDRVLIAMELVRGPTLGHVLATAGVQTPPTVRAIMAQVAQALAVAHGGGVVHRDLKPDNIFWTPEGRAVVADFGLARIGAGRGTVEGTVMGTPGYMAPEQVRGVVAGPATDVFGWGAVAYELASGRPPFGDPAGTDPAALAYRVVHEDPPPLSIPTDPALAALISRTLAKEPSRRPADGGVLAAAMGAPAPPAAPPAPQGAAPAPTRRVPSPRPRRRSLPPGCSSPSPQPAERPRSTRLPAVIAGVLGLVVALVTVGMVAAGSGGDEKGVTRLTAPAPTTTGAVQGSATGKPCVPMADPPPPGAPVVPVKMGPPTSSLVTEDLRVGDGATVPPGATVTVNYIGVACSTGKIFDSSWARGMLATFPLGQVIEGWNQGIPGMRVGGQRLLGIPPGLAYGAEGRPPDISPNETLWFVVDVADTNPALEPPSEPASDGSGSGSVSSRSSESDSSGPASNGSISSGSGDSVSSGPEVVEEVVPEGPASGRKNGSIVSGTAE